VSGAGAIAALPVMASVVGARSPGAVDNASGTAAVLLAAARLPRDLPVGVLLTSAEELGLAGGRAFAQAWSASGRAPATALNCDGVDDVGALVVMHTGGADAVLAHLDAAAARAGVGAARARRLLPGILVDAVALADAGWRAVTVSRGSLATLARIHTAADALPRLRGDGVAAAAALLAALAEALIGDAARGAPARGTAGAPRAARRVARRARDDA
jgi:Zn-dependent M28 family amino/carboxypeptidase